jgi:hypothetical protein
MGRFMGIRTADAEICGAPTDALRQAIAALQPRACSAYPSIQECIHRSVRHLCAG